MTENLRGIGGLKAVLVPMLWLGLAINCPEIIAGFAAYGGEWQSEIIPGYNVYGSIQIISLILTFITYCVFGRWIWVASKNLWDHYVLNYSPASNIWWHAVPFMNLFKPFEAMREVWSRSMGVSEGYGDEAPSHLKIWWGCWVAGNIVTNIAARIPAEQLATLLQIGATALSIVAYYFVIRIVKEITDAQEKGIGGVSEIFA